MPDSVFYRATRINVQHLRLCTLISGYDLSQFTILFWNMLMIHLSLFHRTLLLPWKLNLYRFWVIWR